MTHDPSIDGHEPQDSARQIPATGQAAVDLDATQPLDLRALAAEWDRPSAPEAG